MTCYSPKLPFKSAKDGVWSYQDFTILRVIAPGPIGAGLYFLFRECEKLGEYHTVAQAACAAEPHALAKS